MDRDGERGANRGGDERKGMTKSACGSDVTDRIRGGGRRERGVKGANDLHLSSEAGREERR